MALGQMRFGIQRNEIPMTMIVWDEDALSSRTYSVQGGPFGISTCETCENGQLFLVGDSLNYEEKSTYELIVKVTDNGDPVHVSKLPDSY